MAAKKEQRIEGHGNHWTAVGFDTKQMEWLGNAINDPKTKVYQGARFIGLISPEKPVSVISIIEPEKVRNLLISGYPFLSVDSSVKLTLTSIEPWEYGAEAVLSGVLDVKDGPTIHFFDTHYFLNKDKYTIGEKYKFRLGAIAHSISRRTEDLEIRPDRGAMKGEKLLTHKMTAYFPDTIYEDEFNFIVPFEGYSKTHEIGKTKLYELPFYLNPLEGDKPEFQVPLFVHENTLNGYKPLPGDSVTGIAWLQGCLTE